jgi:hypothetical protein
MYLALSILFIFYSRPLFHTKLSTKFDPNIIGGHDNRTEYNETFKYSNFEKMYLLDLLENTKIPIDKKVLLLNNLNSQIFKGGLLDDWDFI